MKVVIISIGLLGIAYWGDFVGKSTIMQPLKFREYGPIALIGGIVLLILVIFVL